MKKIYPLLIALLLVSILGCKPPLTISEVNYKEHQFEVATADNGYSIDMQTVYDAMYKSKILNLGGILDTFQVRNFIDSMILDSLVGNDATEVKLNEYYNEYRLFKLRYYDILLRQFLKKMVYDKAVSDSVEVSEFYYANEKLFAIDEQLNLYHIGISKTSLLNGSDSLKFRELNEADFEKELFNFVDSVKSLITSPDKFPDIATRFTEDEAAARDGGYIGWTKRRTYPPPFDSIAFELRDGELGGPFKDQDGWHIILVDEYYPAGLIPLNDNLYIAAEKTLLTTKTNEIGAKLIDSLFADFDVYINPEIIDKDVFILDGKTWGAVINGIDTIDCNEARSLEMTFRNNFKVKNTTPDMKQNIFKQIGEKYVMVQAGRNIGLEDDSALIEQREKLTHKYSRSIVLKRRVDIRWLPSDSLIEDYYNSHIEDFETKRPLTVQHIIVEDSLFGEFLRDQAMSGVNFLELANEHYPGEKSIRNDLADLGAIGKNDVSNEFYQTALTTPVGDVSHPVKSEFGYHIIKVLDRKEEATLFEAKRTIAPILTKEYRSNSLKQFKNQLFTKYNVQPLAKLYPVHLKPKSLRK